MAAYNKRKTGFATLAELAIDLINELIHGSGQLPDTTAGAAAGATVAGDAGMKLIFPASAPNKANNLHPTTGYFQSDTYYGDIINGGASTPVARYILESTSEVDVMSVFNNATAWSGSTLPPYGDFANTTLSTGWRICIEFPLVDTSVTAIPGPAQTTTVVKSVVKGVAETAEIKGPPKVYKDFISIYVGTSVQ